MSEKVSYTQNEFDKFKKDLFNKFTKEYECSAADDSVAKDLEKM